MKILVSGATGFIGKYLVRILLENGHTPTIIVRRNTPIPDNYSGLPYVIADLHNPPDNLYEISGSPDLFIHLAWGGLPNYFSIHHIETELPAQFRFIKTLVSSGLKRVLVTGTCFEYGLQNGALSEEMITQPVTTYGFAKDSLRKQLEFLQREYSFSLVWARVFYLFGPGQSENSLYSIVQSAIANGHRTIDMSGGEQLRDFLPVESAADIIVKIGLSMTARGPVNVCSGSPISVRSLVENWLDDYKEEIDLNLGYFPYPSYEPMAFWGNRSNLDRLIQEHRE